jgi:autotransporter-associated beta strand protein
MMCPVLIRFFRFATIVVALTVLVSRLDETAMAQTTWVTPDVGFWTEPSNWDNGVPGSGTDSFVPIGEAIVRAPGAVARSLTVTGSGNTQVTGPTATLTLNSGSPAAPSLVVDTGGTVQVASGGLLTTTLTSLNNGSITITGTGSQWVENSQLVAPAGATNANMTVDNGAAFTATNGIVIGTGATLGLNNTGGTGTVSSAITNGGTLAVDSAGNLTVEGVISGTGALTKAGSGTLILTANNGATGTTTIAAGMLQLGNGGTSGAVNSFAIIDDGVLVLDRSDSITFAGVISGAGSGVKDGNGTLTFAGNNTYSGGTTINAGTLQIGSGGTTGSIVGNVIDNATLVFDRSDTVTFAGVISGTGNLQQVGTGTLVLVADNTYSGATTIVAGSILQLGNGGTVGSVAGAIIDNGTLIVDRSNTVTLPGTISGTGSLQQSGSGITILTGDNTYTGGTTIGSGTLQLGNGGTTGSVTGAVTDNGTLIVNRSDTLVLSGAISGTGSLQQNGSGTTILAIDTTYSGGTTIGAGTLQLGNGGTAGSVVSNVTDNGTLAFNRSNSVSFDGAISGSGAVTQIGTGTTILAGNNSYTGGTRLAPGRCKRDRQPGLAQIQHSR